MCRNYGSTRGRFYLAWNFRPNPFQITFLQSRILGFNSNLAIFNLKVPSRIKPTRIPNKYLTSFVSKKKRHDNTGILTREKLTRTGSF